MNKTELVAAVAEETGKNKADVKEILEALIAQVVKTVKAGDEIALIGFGTFKSAERAARSGRNPASSEALWLIRHFKKFIRINFLPLAVAHSKPRSVQLALLALPRSRRPHLFSYTIG